ncbi:hypothetical protein AXK11_08120 [Cephaloticoccus primus]|uniref:PD-(D/E)XK endonuclease-like domain-containing protein n=1 Tax=Cephaloticoccus primus TaxID=1548207 RepID=A0A139SJK7_9BACT|nr:PD-(D/E)XK nuclease family protein [Cephaloticoccus primus]KXU34684.1 hypothetical protein AXK11_08120 [Cephaloticoccus primus]
MPDQKALRLRFFTWEKPLLGQAVDYLAGDWAEVAGGSGGRGGRSVPPLDLSAQLIIVPTRQAGRRLREALASHAASLGQALFPPLVLTPEALLQEAAGELGAGGAVAEASAGGLPQPFGEAPSGAPSVRRASGAQELLAWVAVLLAADLAEFRALFPVDPPQRNFGWARGLAVQFAQLQSTLRESDLGLAEVAARLGEEEPEWERWQQLAELERRQLARLTRHGGLWSPLAAQRALLARAAPPEGVSRVLVLALADPRPVAVELLERYAKRVEVELLIYAPESEAAGFDAWGRPVPDYWARRELRFEDFESRVNVCTDPHAQAGQLAQLCAAYQAQPRAVEVSQTGVPGGTAAAPDSVGSETSDLRGERMLSAGDFALGVVDPEIFSPLENALHECGVQSFNPEGQSRRGDRLHQLLSALAALAQEESFRNLAAFVRQPDVLLALCGEDGEESAGAEARFLAALDRLHEQHLPADLGAALEWWSRGPVAASAEAACAAGGEALRRVASWCEVLRREAFPANVQRVLGEVFKGRSFDLARPGEAALKEAAEAWRGVLTEVGEAMALHADLRRSEALELALELYAKQRVFAEKPAEAVELQGWLELIWEEAPHLAVAGLNEGLVPSSVTADPFLPEGLRARVGLKTNAQRFAVDAYYLQAIAARAFGRASGGSGADERAEGPGRLDVLLGRVSLRGDPLKPSRLLMRCADEALPGRVAYLFRELPAAGASLAWSRAWPLRLPDPLAVDLPPHLPVTGLRAWLECPLRFYLSRVLKWRGVDAAKAELDAMDFGTLCHTALEAMGREAALRDCTEPGPYREFLRAALDEAVRRQFGARLSLPLVVQVESARQRLEAAAEVQARLRSEGWRIKRVEWAFELEIGALRFAGKVDRLDEHEASGALRVIDYKTSDEAKGAAAVHLGALPKDAQPLSSGTGSSARVGDGLPGQGGGLAAALAGNEAAGEALPEWRVWRAEEGTRPRVWQDLQLPIYERVAAGEFAGREVRCGYFHLPKAVGDVGLTLWEDYTPELAASAWACAQGVSAAIARREFWPPRELKGREAERDDFAALFQRGAAASIGWAPVASSPTPTPAQQGGMP